MGVQHGKREIRRLLEEAAASAEPEDGGHRYKVV